MNEFDSPVSISNLIDKSLNVISVISNCIATVLVEKQKTKQIEAQSRVLIEESKQSTNRIKMQENEHTKRFLIECRTELEKTKYELKKLYEKNRFKEIELKQNHIEYMEIINRLKKQIDDIMSKRDRLFEAFYALDQYEQALGVLRETHVQLLDLDKQLVKFRMSESKKE